MRPAASLGSTPCSRSPPSGTTSIQVKSSVESAKSQGAKSGEMVHFCPSIIRPKHRCYLHTDQPERNKRVYI